MNEYRRDGVALTAIDLKCLRHADDICLDLYDTPDSTNPRISQIRAIRKSDRYNKDGFVNGEATHTFPVGYSLTSYSAGYSSQPSRMGRCFDMLSCSKFNEVVYTILNHVLRVGDVISIHWSADNNSQIIKDAGLHHDEISLIVKRGNKTMTFLLKSNVSLDNSARSVQLY